MQMVAVLLDQVRKFSVTNSVIKRFDPQLHLNYVPSFIKN